MMLKEPRWGAKAKAMLLLVLISGLVVLVFVWRWTSMGAWLDIDQLVGQLRLTGGALGLLASIGCIVLASVVAVPLGVIIVVSAITFGPWLGCLFVISGACIGGVISYALGSFLGHEALCRFAGKRVNDLSTRLKHKGVLAVIVIRMLPIAPFAIVNMIAGATHLRMIDFVIGTFFGMIPGVVAITFFSDWIVRAVSS
mgnify:FL=1